MTHRPRPKKKKPSPDTVGIVKERTGQGRTGTVKERTGQGRTGIVKERTGQGRTGIVKERTGQGTTDIVKERTGQGTTDIVKERTGQGTTDIVKERTGQGTTDIVKERTGPDNGHPKKPARVTGGFIPAYVHADDECVVCGDKPTGTHYHAMTCEGCKGFFRRTTQASKGKPPKLTCKKENNNCEIKTDTRNTCQFCRYKKCLKMRMDPKLVKSDIERKKLKKLIATNKTKRMKKIMNILNLTDLDVLNQIANNYKSLSTHGFFRFISKDEEPEQYVTNEMTSTISHAFNFVRSIPGINKIDPDDFLSLVKTHLIDVLVLLMAEMFNRSENVLCFTNCNLHESFLVERHEEYRSIFEYAKYYSRFVTNDGMVLGCLAALRFLNTDGIVLKDPDTVDKALENILHISIKFWNKSNKTLMTELLAGLPNFENVKDKAKSFIAFINSNLDNFQSRLVVHPLFSHSANSSPEYETRNTSTASSFISTCPSTSDTFEEEDDSDSVKHEMSCGGNFIFDKNVNSQSGDEYMDAQFQRGDECRDTHFQIDECRDAHFQSDDEYRDANFQRGDEYRDAPFQSDNENMDTHFQRGVEYRDAHFQSDDENRDAHFQRGDECKDAHFQSGDEYRDAHFQRGDENRDAHFQRGDECKDAHFQSGDECRDAHFQSNDENRDTHFQSNDNRDTHFQRGVEYRDAHLQRGVEYRNAHFQRGDEYRNAHFQRGDEYRDAHLQRGDEYREADFQSNNEYRNAHFQRGNEYREAHFQMQQTDSRNVAQNLSDNRMTSALYGNIIMNDHSKQDDRQLNSSAIFFINNHKPAQPSSIPQARMIDNPLIGKALSTLELSNCHKKNARGQVHSYLLPQPAHQHRPSSSPSSDLLIQPTLSMLINSGREMNSESFQAAFLKDQQDEPTDLSSGLRYSKMSAVQIPYDNKMSDFRNPSHIPGSPIYNTTKSPAPSTSFTEQYPAGNSSSTLPSSAFSSVQVHSEVKFNSKFYNCETISLTTKFNVPKTGNSISIANETTNLTSCQLYTDNPKQSDEPQSSAHAVKLPSREPSVFCQRFPKIKKLWMHQFNDDRVSNN